MALARYERPIQDGAGNLIGNVYCEVRREVSGAPLANLYSDRDGLVPMSNPALFVDGVVAFHALGGALKLHVYATGYDETFRYVAIGTAAERDADVPPTGDYIYEIEAGTAAPPTAGCIRANNANLSAATSLFVSSATFAGSDIEARLLELASGAKAVKNRLVVTFDDGTTASWQVSTAVDSGVYVTLAVSGHVGATAWSGGVAALQFEITGADGFVPGVSMTFSTTTSAADPGAGKFRLNHATPASATAAYIDNVEALGGTSITTWLDSWDDTAGTLKGTLLIASKSDPAAFYLFNVTGTVVDSTGYRTVTIAYVAGAGTLPDLTGCVLVFNRAGAAGSNGSNGADGYSPGFRLTFDTTVTDSDPGAGKVRFNHATFASITYVYCDDTDASAASITTWLDGLDDVSNANARAYLRFQKATDPTVYAEFSVVGAVVNGTGYRKIPVSPIAGAVPANATTLVATASKSGADASANTAELETAFAQLALQVADNSNVALFLGPSGNRVADSFDALTYVDTAGATNLDTGTAGVLKPTVSAGTTTTINTQTTTAAISGFATFSRSGALPNSKRIDKIGVYSTAAKSIPLKIALENSSTSYDFVWTETFAHPGGGWVDYTPTAPYTTPASGTYRLGAYTASGSPDVNASQLRSIVAGDQGVAAGVTMTAATAQVYPMRYTVDVATNNLSVRSTSFTAASAPTTMKALLRVKEVDAAVAGTDYTFECSRDGGTTWTTMTLTELFTSPSPTASIRVVEAAATSVTGQPSGTSPRYRFQTLNNKMVEAHDAYLYWST